MRAGAAATGCCGWITTLAASLLLGDFALDDVEGPKMDREINKYTMATQMHLLFGMGLSCRFLLSLLFSVVIQELMAPLPSLQVLLPLLLLLKEKLLRALK
jgi:hypothetical protein